MSGKVFYNKLIRDNIPEKIAKAGATCETKVLSDTEFEEALLKKVEEEASALPKVTTREELIEELADVLDVIDEIKRVKKIEEREVQEAQAQALEKKGGFTKKLFLIWSSDDGYKTNEKRNA